MKIAKIVFAFVLLAIAISYAGSKNIKADFVKAKVLRVIDGDTVVVSIPKITLNNRKTLKNLRFTVRLIGIDTPESKPNRRAKIQSKQSKKNIKEIISLGKKAKEFTKRLLPKGKSVYLEFDIEPQDRYGRLLAYIWLPSGRMVNMLIICNGYAYPLTVPPNVKYEKQFLKCFKKAYKEKLGLWR